MNAPVPALDDDPITAEEYAEIALELSEESALVVLGGACGTDEYAAEIADALHMAGALFLHADDVSCLPRAVYIVAVNDPKYSTYEFPPGSQVIDPHSIVPSRRGVKILCPTSEA